MTTHAGENGETLRPEEPLRDGDPRELGPYRLLGRLGRGGMGTVYLGEDGAGRRLAVKVINRELAGEGAFRDRFRREVTAARQVRRFCTAPVLDAELDRDPLWVVTEYIDGPSLEQAVLERGPLPGSDLEGLAVGVATALAAIHGAGIVHRDLKPANVLLSSTGPRVIDFGIARALDAADGPTRTGTFVGTPNYLPPELLRGEPVTPASDIFSWGCVVAYAGTGSPPFQGATVPEIFYKVAHDAPKLDGLDPGLRDLVAAALDKDPRNRPTVQDLLGRLVGHGQTDPAAIAETVQASWHAGPPPATTGPTGFPHPTAMLGADETRHDAPMSHKGANRPPLPLLIGIAAAAAALIAAIIIVPTVLSGDDPPDKLATVFSDDFSQDGSGWGGGRFTSGYGYKDAKFRIETNSVYNPHNRGAPKDAKDLPDRLLTTVTVKVEHGAPDSRVGVLARATEDGKRQYMIFVRADGKGALIRKSNGDLGTKELVNVDSAPGWAEGEANRLQVACESQDGGKKVRLRLWVNDEQVLDITDADQPLPNGPSGVTVERGGNAAQQVVADFDDFDMSKILD